MLVLQIVNAAATTTLAAAADTLSKVATNTVVATEQPTEDSFSLLSMVAKGGPMMIPLGILFLASIYVLIERLITISKASKKNSGLLASLQGLIKQGNLQAARSLCMGQASPEIGRAHV